MSKRYSGLRMPAILIVLTFLLAPFQNCGSGLHSQVHLQQTGQTSTSAPKAPSALAAEALSSQEISLSWMDNSNNETKFRIFRASSVAGPFVTVKGSYTLIAEVAPNTTFFSDTGLDASAEYNYKVVAMNSGGSSEFTSEVTATTPAVPTTPPSPPSTLTTTATAATLVNIVWSDNSNNESNFKIERSADNGTTFTLIATTSANQISYRDFNLDPQTLYVYRVRALNQAGNSAFTANSTVTTQAAGDMTTYSYVSVNILGPNCATCHNSNSASGGVRLHTYDAVRSYLTPGSSSTSLFYTAITSGRMPPSRPLTTVQKNALASWIDAGAQNN